MDNLQLPFIQLYRINALRAMAVFAFCLIAVTAAPPPLPVVGLLFELLGILAIFVAIAGRAWALLYIGGRKNSELVTFGPYSISRNPLYVFSLIGIAGIGSQTGSLLSMGIIIFAAYVAFHMAMRGEEAYLANRYGTSFDTYRQAVPRFWPDFSLWKECEDIPLRSAGAVRSLRDGIVFLAAWIVLELLKLGQVAGFLPVVWILPV